MGLFGIPEDRENLHLTHPLDQLLHREILGAIGLVITNDSVEFFNSKNSALEQSRR